MAANGISTLATKELRQVAKLDIAQAKRQGKTVAVSGTITGAVDPTANSYRYWNTYDANELPAKYVGDIATPDSDSLNSHRPWKTHT